MLLSLSAPLSNHLIQFNQQGILYMYGGVTQDGDILSQLWTLNLSTKEWTQLMPSRNKECYHRPCGPVAAAGHSVVLVKDKMYTIFGYNPIYGYLNLIQEYSIGNQNYSINFFFLNL